MDLWPVELLIPLAGRPALSLTYFLLSHFELLSRAEKEIMKETDLHPTDFRRAAPIRLARLSSSYLVVLVARKKGVNVTYE